MMNALRLPVRLFASAALGASLIAVLTGCQSSPSNGLQGSGPYGQFGQAGDGQMASSYGGPAGQPPYGPGQAGMLAHGGAPSQSQAFLAETQRMRSQPLAPQDVIAMTRSGVPDQQILAAVQQRGAALRGPGVPEYLAQQGVSPQVVDALRSGTPAAMMGGPRGGSPFASPGTFGSPYAASGQPAPGGALAGDPSMMPGGGQPAFASAQPAGSYPAGSYPGQGLPAYGATGVQPAGFETPASSPFGPEPSATSPAAGPGQAWHPKTP
jgi:hypothetical protein